MPISEEERYAGVEDEFRVAAADGHSVYLDELVSRSQRFFFDESGHVPILEPVHDPDSVGGRIWTWYGGTLYHDYDSIGCLLEATTPLTPLGRGIEAMVDNVLTQRAQLLELSKGESIIGVSTHLNLLLDSRFGGNDLCQFKARIPSNAFAYVEAQKLGADIALVATHTISPIIAYLLFNHKPTKGALYRPRKNRRMELCLPYIPDPDQMRAGFLFWFVAVDYIAELIKADLSKHQDWAERYSHEDYYRIIVSKFPFVVSDIKFRRPSYYLGYEIDYGVEENVMENGSKAVVKTETGDMNIIDLAKAYVEFFSSGLVSRATRRELALLDDFVSGRRELNIDVKEAPRSLRLNHAYMERAIGKPIGSYLNEHEVDELASVHLNFISSPFRVMKPHSRIRPGRIVRNLVNRIEWDTINLEVVEETESVVRRYSLEIPLHQTSDYLKLEKNFSSLGVFMNEIEKWTKSVTEIPNPRSVFAYGTLMNPETDMQNFGVAITSVRSGHAYGEAYDFGEYPVLIENYRSSVVPGVLLSLLDFEEGAAMFDFYEGCHNPNPVFIRALRQILLGDFENTTSWVYIGNRNNRMVRDKMRRSYPLQGVWSKASMRSHQIQTRLRGDANPEPNEESGGRG